MKILSSSQIREVDAYTIEHEPISSVDLMERAAVTCADWILNRYGNHQNFVIFVGSGNNGGDGLAIARFLTITGKSVTVYLLTPFEKLSTDSKIIYKRLSELPKTNIHEIHSKNFSIIQPTDIVVDALFGTGLSRPTEGLAASVIEHINNSNATVISIDVPSGLNCEKAQTSETIIKATHTITFQMPKLSFLFAENEKFVGEWEVLDIQLSKKGIELQNTAYHYLTFENIQTTIKHRAKFSHKGTYGHALLVAGSYGMIGAAVLASRACLRSGVGLLTTHIPKCGYEIMQISVPECKISVDVAMKCSSQIYDFDDYSAIGIGSGIGLFPETSELTLKILQNCQVPLVIDADAINQISMNKSFLNKLPENTILTPHPKEFDRLIGQSTSGFDRFVKQIEFSKKYKVIVVLKGAHTSISLPNGDVYFNSTGNSGMATAGSGDVLTGIILSLLAQGYVPQNAACLAVFLHGIAGDLASQSTSEEAIIASDIIENIGLAFKKLKNNTSQ